MGRDDQFPPDFIALAGHFETTRIAGAATKFAAGAALVAKGIGRFFSIAAIVDTLDALDDPGTDTAQLVTMLVGQCMVFAGSVMPPPLGFVVSGVGQVIVWVAGLLADPPPDDLIPVIEPLVASNVITESEKVAILEAHSTNIWALGRALGLAPKDVRWGLETVRLDDDNNMARNPGHFGAPEMGLYRIHLETGLHGDAMAEYLREIARSSGVEGRFELHVFTLYSAASALFSGRSVREALVERRSALVEYDVKYDAKPVGIAASRALSLAKSAFDRAIGGLPTASCPEESAARCSGDGRFVVWCDSGRFLQTYDCWDDDKSCKAVPEEGRSHCLNR